MPRKIVGAPAWKLNRAQLARELGVSTRTIAKWMALGLIPYHKWGGGMVRFDLNAVKAALEKRKVKEVA